MAEATFGRGNRQGRGNMSNDAAQRMLKRDYQHMSLNKFSSYDRESHMNRTEEVNMPSKKLRRDRQYGEQSCFTDAAAYQYDRWRGSRDIAGPDSFTVRNSSPRTGSSGNSMSHQSVNPNTRYDQDDSHGHKGTHTSGSSGRWYMFVSPLNSEASNVGGNKEEHLDSPVTKECPSSGKASICVEDNLAPCREVMVNLKAKCEQEENAEFRQTLLDTWKEHEKECFRYMLQPSSHPNHDSEYKKYCEQQFKKIFEAGNDPRSFDFQQGWKEHWPGRMSEFILESWEKKVSKCLYTECNQPARRKSVLKVNLNNPVRNNAEIEKNPKTEPENEAEGDNDPSVSEVDLNNPVSDKDEKEEIPITELKREADGSVSPPISEVNLNNPVSDKAERVDIPVDSNTKPKRVAGGATASPVSKVSISEEFRHSLRRLYLHIQDRRRIRVKTGEKADFYLRGQKYHISSEWIWEARLVKPGEIVGMNISRWWTKNIPPSIEKLTPEGTLVAVSKHGNFSHNSESFPESKEGKVCKHLSEVSNDTPENKSSECKNAK